MESRAVRSYKLRGRRITEGQQEAWDRLWPVFGIEYSDAKINLADLFPDSKRIIMEIGFGMGEATAQIAAADPTTGYLAVEVHRPGIGKLLLRIEEVGLKNVRAIEGDAFEVFEQMIVDSSLDGVHLFFPDPWPKARHFKRRIVNQEFIAAVAAKLKPGAFFHIATDWQPYAEWIAEEFTKQTFFTGGEVDRPDWRPLTRFEDQGINKEHPVADFRFIKK
ncbi:MAG: tRNA (guanosine(46)-N7)-methyltransferase TrmB [Candidatus Nanopelagicales bacterium]|nr:tRNA (guanosine(46)-N7)-methyltransferase TrmB [Candidatus Nanopelagicales bacterium]